MEKTRNNSIFKILLVLCLSFTLLLSQTGRLHMHLEHNDHTETSAAAFNAHVVDIHPELTLHDFELTNHHNGYQHSHSTIAVDVSTDKLLKKINLLDPLVLILLFIGFFLYLPRLRSVGRQTPGNIFFSRCYYLLQPPLRRPSRKINSGSRYG